MKLNVINSDGGKGEAISVDKSVFGIKPNEVLFIRLLLLNWQIVGKERMLQKIDLQFVVEEKSHLSRRGVVLLELEQLGRRFGEVVEQSLVNMLLMD